jgi:hypothetical protein
MMKFSVLLPTRNGGDFLAHCIESILSSKRDDIELIVSDNANTDMTRAVLNNWSADNRLKIIHQENALSVTDNWNATLKLATGDYLLMMGDDDCLLPGYFESMSDLIEQYEQPDCILYNGISYVAPLSIGSDQLSYYSPQHFRFGSDLTQTLVLDPELRKRIVVDMFDFKVRIPLNMQTTLVKRQSSERIVGGLFQPPFPDHFALNAMLLTCDRWVFTPKAHVVVGVSPKSFGHYIYSQKQASGLNYLGISSDFVGRLPGNELLNGMYVWLCMLKQAYPQQLSRVNVNRGGYVRRQVYAWLIQCRMGEFSWHEGVKRLFSLSTKDKLHLLSTIVDSESWRRLLKVFSLNKKDKVGQQWQGLRPLENIKNIAEFSAWYRSR